jgi:hypothetical protein
MLVAMAPIAQAQYISGDVEKVRQRVRDFTGAWLIRKSIPDALKYFDHRIFSSPAMYKAECASFAGLDLYTRERDREKAVKSALEWYAGEMNGRTDFYRPEGIEIASEEGTRPLNDVAKDRFVILRGDARSGLPLSQDPAASEDLRRLLGVSPFYVVVLPLVVGPAFFIWVQRQGTWKILHAETFCE